MNEFKEDTEHEAIEITHSLHTDSTVPDLKITSTLRLGYRESISLFGHDRGRWPWTDLQINL